MLKHIKTTRTKILCSLMDAIALNPKSYLKSELNAKTNCQIHDNFFSKKITN